ncbi:MAG: response regulator [Deltaproteobacteria bacterium]|nr:response regulator [Deltaproteobacteria bacterium]
MATLPKVYLEHLAEISPDIIIAVDRQGRIIFYNDGARRTLGYCSEEVLGRHVTLIYGDIAEARRLMAAMRSAERGAAGSTQNFETTVIDKWGERIPAAISGSIIKDAAGNEIGSIGFAKDLREIRQRQQLATMAEIAVSLAHQINNPLEAIANQLELLAKCVAHKCTDEEFVVEGERLDAIQSELGRIRDTIGRIQQAAGERDYGTREYLPGQLMTDLGSRANGKDACHLDGVRVLVVDDDTGVCNSLRDVLREEHCQVFTASGGLEALRLLQAESVDVVLSDVVMPDMDGYDLYMELKERLPRTPVVLMTAYYYDKDHVIKRSRLEGLDQVIFKKPIDPKRLMTIIEQVSKRPAPPA